MRYKPSAVIMLLVSGMSVISPSLVAGGASGLVEAPVPAPSHKFFNRANLALFGISALIMVADVSTTRRALQTPGTRELNPLAQSPTQLDVLKFAGLGAGFGIAYMLHRQGHCKAERFVPVLVALPSAAAALRSATLGR